MKRRYFAQSLLAVALIAFCWTPAMAGSPSSKLAASIGNISMLNNKAGLGGDPTNPSSIMTTTIKKANGKDLAMLVSVECGNFTKTEVKSKGGNKDSSTAIASVAAEL